MLPGHAKRGVVDKVLEQIGRSSGSYSMLSEVGDSNHIYTGARRPSIRVKNIGKHYKKQMCEQCLTLNPAKEIPNNMRESEVV